MKIVVVSLIIISINFVFVPATFGKKEDFSVSIALNTSLKQTNQSIVSSQKLVNKHKNGIKTIRGPVNLSLMLSEAASFDIDNVNLILIRNKNSRVNYVQVFPLEKNLDQAGLQSLVNSYEKRLVATNWQKISLPKKKSILQNVGAKDLAHYKFSLDAPFNGIREYEMVFTRFIDAKVNCPALTHNSKCKNCFLRISLSSVSS